jgi:nitroreductase
MELTDLEKLIKSRCSIRKWQNKPVSEELLLKAIELATWVPNAGNQQNWRFYIVLNKGTIELMAKANQEIANEVASWLDADQQQAEATRWRDSGSRFKSAPALIGVAASQYQSLPDIVLISKGKTDAKAGQIRDWRNAADSRIQSVAAAINCLILVLHQMGLGTVWMTGPMQAKGELEKILHIPQGMDLIALIPVGYPDESPAAKERKPVKEVCEIIK